MSHTETRPALWCWTAGQEGLAKPLSPDAAAVAGWGQWGAALHAAGPWQAAPCPWHATETCLLSPGDSALPPVVLTGPSTSAFDVAWALRKSWQPVDFTSILTISQSAGRGQLRRAWHSPPQNLHAAIVWPGDGVLAGRLAFLGAGLAVAEAVESLGYSLQLKWPNDLLLSGKKVGGLLVEERGGAIVVGIGINVSWAPASDELREGHAVGATALGWSDGGPLRLWLAMLPKLVQGCKVLQWLSPGELCAMADARLAWRGQTVRLRAGQDARGTHFDNCTATIVRVGVEGYLQVHIAGREHHLTAAEMHPVIPSPY